MRARGPRALSARLSADFDRLPIRVRLASVSALLTFVILCGFAIIIGSLTAHRIRNDFNREVSETANALPNEMRVTAGDPFTISPELKLLDPPGDHAVIRLLDEAGDVLRQYPAKSPKFASPEEIPPQGTVVAEHDYRVVTKRLAVLGERNGTLVQIGKIIFQYARPMGPTEATVDRVELLLFLGVIAGSVLAFGAGMLIARRAMKPIQTLTATAAEIARTRDPSRHMPEGAAEDEVSELARTLEAMLRELDAARSETESMLARQRSFVADASHELRTPLTSVLANLELLAESLQGDEGDAARSALRSSQRMRRLVGDLLLLARSDAARSERREPCDLAEIVVDAAAELGPVSTTHEISLDVHPAKLIGARDDLHRLVINLIENALRHTPDGTEIDVSTVTLADGHVELIVADNGPGVPPQLAPTLFERFVRGAGDRGGSFGLGLAIVAAVASSHGGSVKLDPAPTGTTGARFVVRLSAGGSDLDDDGQHHRPALEALVD